MSVPFVHLRLHTEYSIEDSIIQINDLKNTASTSRLPALALTDRMNLFGSIKFYSALSAVGVKPILGVDALLVHAKGSNQLFRCVLLCQTEQGYHNLLMLVSRAYQERLDHKEPVIQTQWLCERNAGLIVLSGGIYGDIGQALIDGRKKEAVQYLRWWQSFFPGRYYIELQRMGQPNEALYIEAACALARSEQVPVVATHDIRFLKFDDFEAHEARVCIQKGDTLNNAKRSKQYTAAQYLKSTEEMQTLFKDIPSALKNSVEIAKRCNVTLDIHAVHLPNFTVPEAMDAKAYLIQEAEKGLSMRFSQIEQSTNHFKGSRSATTLSIEAYQARLKRELEVINSMGFASYFLIVADFIRWAKQKRIPVGPGRGSGAGSLVAYALQITDVDPLCYGLLFERFLNAERVSLPDFDIDFCMEDRDRVIDYVMNRYGRNAVAQIITFGTMAARAVIRDVGRVLGYPYGMVDAIAKLIPFEVGMTLSAALQRDEKSHHSLKARYENEDEIKVLIDLAKKLEGLVRNVGTHAGGVVITPGQLTDFTALYYESDSKHAITQFDKDDLEAVGLVKFDFLGLRTLTIINWAVASINKKRADEKHALLDITQLPLDDKKTFNLLRSKQVMGVFQLESRGIQALLKRLAPDHFEDIVALIALFRPGPLQSGMVDDFIQRKHDASQIKYFHPLLEPILRSTYGVILYQEQVMQIAQVLAGYSLGAADLLRRAMGKKKPAEMAKQRAIFTQGSEKNGIDKVFANTMFDLIEKFAGYGFNKSHSVAYALISYQTAWLKAHYPREFMAAVLSAEMEHTEKLATLLYECRALGLKVKPPNIHSSQYAFIVNAQQEIEYGLGAIKGVGRAAVAHLLAVQKQQGPFQNLFELCQRAGGDKLNRRTLEALIESGCLDVFGLPRSTLSHQLAQAMQMALHQATALLTKQSDLFGSIASDHIMHMPQTAAMSTWRFSEQLKKEKKALGIYLSAHPLVDYQNELSHLRLTDLKEVYRKTRSPFLCAAWLVDIRLKFTARGDKFAILLFEDATCRLELRLSQTQYQAYREKLIKDTLFVIELETHLDKVSQEPRLTISQLWDAAAMRETWGRCLRLKVEAENIARQKDWIQRLKQILEDAKGGRLTSVLVYHRDKAAVSMILGENWKMHPHDQNLEALKALLGDDNVWIEYP